MPRVFSSARVLARTIGLLLGGTLGGTLAAQPVRSSPSVVPIAADSGASAGLTLARLPDGNRRVATLDSGGAAHRAGMQIGDLVFEINGIASRAMSDADLAALLRGTAVVRLAVRRGEEEVEFAVTPKPTSF